MEKDRRRPEKRMSVKDVKDEQETDTGIQEVNEEEKEDDEEVETRQDIYDECIDGRSGTLESDLVRESYQT